LYSERDQFCPRLSSFLLWTPAVAAWALVLYIRRQQEGVGAGSLLRHITESNKALSSARGTSRRGTKPPVPLPLEPRTSPSGSKVTFLPETLIGLAWQRHPDTERRHHVANMSEETSPTCLADGSCALAVFHIGTGEFHAMIASSAGLSNALGLQCNPTSFSTSAAHTGRYGRRCDVVPPANIARDLRLSNVVGGGRDGERARAKKEPPDGASSGPKRIGSARGHRRVVDWIGQLLEGGMG
jgi:hypothetical protein